VFLSLNRAERQGLRSATIRGVHLAVVTAHKDAPPDNPGYRVKVKIPTLTLDEETFYARIAVPMAGKNRGTYTLPEVNDQVLIVFEHGFIDRPIIIGALWSKQQQPAETNASGKNNTKLIKSRSGHRIIFDDAKGHEKIVIVDSTNKNKIILDASTKTVKIESAGDILIKAKQNVILHANALKVGASEMISAKANAICVHAISTLSFKASQEIILSGSQVVMNVTNDPACAVSGAGTGEFGGVFEEQPKPQQQDDNAAQSRKGTVSAATDSTTTNGTTSDSPAVVPSFDPEPVLVSAKWSTDRTTVSTTVTLSAIAVDMAGQSATFTIRDASDPDTVVATVSGSCDVNGVKVSWTTPPDAPPTSFDFEVSASGKRARSGVLVLVRKFEATLMLGDEPAAGAAVRLRIDHGGEELHGTADEDGVVRFPDAPFGNVTLFLERT